MQRNSGSVLLPWGLAGACGVVTVIAIFVFIGLQPSDTTQVACGLGDQNACTQITQISTIRGIAVVGAIVPGLSGFGCLIWAIIVTATNDKGTQQPYIPPMGYGPPPHAPYAPPPYGPSYPTPNAQWQYPAPPNAHISPLGLAIGSTLLLVTGIGFLLLYLIAPFAAPSNSLAMFGLVLVSVCYLSGGVGIAFVLTYLLRKVWHALF